VEKSRLSAATVVAVFFLAMALGCNSVPLTEGAKRTRMIQPDWANSCKFITSEEITNASFGASPAVCAKRAHDSMRNRVAELGGNAYLVTYRTVGPCLAGGTTISFEAYLCSAD
jgi:hypothetical protein